MLFAAYYRINRDHVQIIAAYCRADLIPYKHPQARHSKRDAPAICDLEDASKTMSVRKI